MRLEFPGLARRDRKASPGLTATLLMAEGFQGL